jgi:hypothetical protein
MGNYSSGGMHTNAIKARALFATRWQIYISFCGTAYLAPEAGKAPHCNASQQSRPPEKKIWKLSNLKIFSIRLLINTNLIKKQFLNTSGMNIFTDRGKYLHIVKALMLLI